MSLQLWMPLMGDLRNQGLGDYSISTLGTLSWVAGKLGSQAMKAGDGTQVVNGIRIEDTFTDLLNGNYSVSVWLKPYGTHVHYNGSVFSSGNWNTANKRWAFGVSQDNTKVDVLCMNYNTYIDCSVPVNEWTHIVCTRDNNDIVKLYKNGNYIGERNCSLDPDFASDATFTCIGRESYANGYFSFNGAIQDFRLYDHCLSPMEVKQISQGLVLHYPLNRQGWGQENLLSRYVVPGQAAPTSTAAGGRTTWLGDYKITIPATENADTYFRLFTTKQLTANATYTISCQVSGLKDGSYYRFPLYAQNNTGMGVLQLDHNGLCYLTFVMTYGTQTAATGANGETVYICFMDDSGRALASGQGAITVSNFKLEEGSIATPWCPNSADTLYSTMGLNGTTEYDCSGFCNNGEKIGALTYTSDTPKYQVSTHIGATNQKIHISNFPTSGFGNTYSFAWWGKNTTFSNKMFWGFSDGIRLNGMYSGVLWNTGDSSNNPLYKINTTTQVSAPSVNTWHHYVMTGNGTKCYVYLDGELWAEAKTYKAISGTSIYINGWGNTTDYCYDNMDISDFRIYATALSADDVKSLYQNSAYIDSSGNIYGVVH